MRAPKRLTPPADRMKILVSCMTAPAPLRRFLEAER